MRYEIQKVTDATYGFSYRITDTKTDSRIGTCYLEENAELIVDALNFYATLTDDLERQEGWSSIT